MSAAGGRLGIGGVGLVTGGGSGLGREIVLLAAARGADVVVADRDLEAASATADDAVAAGGRARAVHLDVADESSVEAVFGRLCGDGAQLSWAVNNAGIHAAPTPLTELEITDFDRVVGVNARGVALCLKHELRAMRERGGSIVNVGSTRSFRAQAGAAAYVASKAAVIGLTETAALEGGPLGVRVNCVSPGVMATPMVRTRRALSEESEEAYLARLGGVLGRIGEPVEVAEAVLWLISDAASYVTGHTLVADGGYLIR
jgi:NAD(P)-dependent dehydrogenase (short-subunit alcohol dehydrogenase family)